jgi:hypothetical protein
MIDTGFVLHSQSGLYNFCRGNSCLSGRCTSA